MSTEIDRDQRISVFVRVKPLSQKEINNNYTEAVHVISDRKVIVHKQSHDEAPKNFTFDRVFHLTSSQVDVFQTVAKPLIKDVLAGYNCAIFAYGQTGTGKTYTMEGVWPPVSNLHRQSYASANLRYDTFAGMIPRCLSHLFDELRMLRNQWYSVKVSFLELYNEKLFDLLSQSTNDDTKIKLYEDTSKKGSIIIVGLEEVTVRDEVEVYEILERASKKKQIASKRMNSNSNRSHTIFSVIVHTQEGRRLKMAKLNLVDLAGIQSKRAAEEYKIANQSLLTLHSVITALVEKAPHVPYRESKLTRLLQESLSGCTKTFIIATVSSSSSNVVETLSTLYYAHHAKHITNRPKINKIFYNRTLMKEHTEELEKLGENTIVAAYQKDDIYLKKQKYGSMHDWIEQQREEIKTKIDNVKILEEEIESKRDITRNIQLLFDVQRRELTEKRSKLNKLMSTLQSTTNFMEVIDNNNNAYKCITEKYAETHNALQSQIKALECIERNIRRLAKITE